MTAAGGRGRELLQMGGGDLPQYQQAIPHKLLQTGEGDTVGARSTMPIPIACYCLPACLATIAIQWLELATVFFLHPASQWNMTGSASTFLLLGLLCLKYKNSLSGFGRKISPFHHQLLGLASQANKNTRFGAKEI